jgi:hypothetical protein
VRVMRVGAEADDFGAKRAKLGQPIRERNQLGQYQNITKAMNMK